ncbi:MAG: hypothetical protein NVS9B4_14200 [Candidatus Acidiferrum sp.]
MKNRQSVRRAILAVVFLATFAGLGAGQDAKRETQLRTVHGLVTDKSDTPAPTSVVFLKNIRSNDVRSHYADDAGNYSFSGLDPNADYEIHAEKDAAESSLHTISSFDGRKDMTLNLKLDKKKN